MGNLHFHSGYVWLFATALCLGIAITVRRYRRYDISFGKRWFLIVLRILTLSLLCNLASEPALDAYHRTIRLHTLAVLLDTSMSMQLREDGQTRWERAKHILSSYDLPDAVQVQVYGWDGNLFPMNDLESIEPDGKITGLGDALQGALDQLQTQRPATLFLISDGGHNHGGSPLDAARRAHSMNLPIHTILVGGEGPRDIKLRVTEAPPFVFAGSQCSAQVFITQHGFDNLKTEVIVEHKQPDSRWDEVARSPVSLQGPGTSLEIGWTPSGKGAVHYRIRVAEQTDEAVSANNVTELQVNVITHKLRVRYLESAPRWDARFLRNAMLRDETIQLNWQLGVSEFSLEEMEKDQLLWLGDVPQDWLRAHADQIAHFVDAGGGLLLQPGRRYEWDTLGPVMAKLLPVRLGSKRDRPQSSAYLPEVTANGRKHPASQKWASFLDSTTMDSAYFFHDHYPIQSLKPNASCLMAHPTERVDNAPLPVMAYQYYGKGRVLFLGTDELWRWKKGMEETDFYQLWSYTIRWLALTHLFDGLERVQLISDGSRHDDSGPIHVIAHVRDQDYNPVTREFIGAVLFPGDERVKLLQRASEPGVYDADLKLGAGQYQLVLDEEGKQATLDLKVEQRNLEWQTLSADPEILRQIAAMSGGSFRTDGTSWNVPLEPEIVETLHSIPLWDNTWVLVLVLLLLSVEWVLKRRWHLR